MAHLKARQGASPTSVLPGTTPSLRIAAAVGFNRAAAGVMSAYRLRRRFGEANQALHAIGELDARLAPRQDVRTG
ncbi:hypothetical protein VFPFJ_08735 [Purpureocillium lilacinum]|uniref:Uncharacterized protein n=1 Tax=Purpureocillium lilacinum TaxID=33203 RepID=A0A179GYQ9_PURLI|nr:hypothetical protein VFPFJ_08735 [Purpureocillium lilacinum]OAQ82932.1 hypothetical protein VFPFJ_08735 [Purpureocillium lilacinum]